MYDRHYRVADHQLPKFLGDVDYRYCWPVPRDRRQRDGLPPHPVGHGFVHFADGWTVIAWADNAVNSRPGANVAFAMLGYLRWQDALARAREVYPRELAAREAVYEVRLAGCDLPEDPVEEVAYRTLRCIDELHPSVRSRVLAELYRRAMHGP